MQFFRLLILTNYTCAFCPAKQLACTYASIKQTHFYPRFSVPTKTKSSRNQGRPIISVTGSKTSHSVWRVIGLHQACTFAQSFSYCRPYYVYFYELRPPVDSRYFRFWHCFCSASAHGTKPASRRLFGRLSTTGKYPHHKIFYNNN